MDISLGPIELGERVSTSHGTGVVKEILENGSYRVKLMGEESSVDQMMVLTSSEFERMGLEYGAQTQVKLPELDDIRSDLEMPVDPAILTGKFSSGMSYYVLGNKEPPNRCELTVVIKTGSIHETDQEKGIAHMLEHLTFRASKEKLPNGAKITPSNSPPSSSGEMENTNAEAQADFSLVRKLEENGIQFGAHQNAYTTFDETVYFLHVPMEEAATVVETGDDDRHDVNQQEDRRLAANSLLAECIEIISSLVLAARVTDEDVQAERSIIVEEWRSNQGVSQRWSDRYFEELLKGSRYAERLPIGSLDVIRNISGESMRKFYSSRYHPSLMAVIAVGDFIGKEATVVEMLRRHFDNATNAHWEEALHLSIPSASPSASNQEISDEGESVKKEHVLNEKSQNGTSTSKATSSSNIAVESEEDWTRIPEREVRDSRSGRTSLTPSAGLKELPVEPDRAIENIFGKESVCVVMQDPEATYSQANVSWKSRAPSIGTIGTTRRSLLDQLTVAVMNSRFNRMALKSKPPFTSASIEDVCPVICVPPDLRESSKEITSPENSTGASSSSDSTQDKSIRLNGVRAITLSVSAPEGELSHGLQQAWCEVRRAQLFGFCDKELDRIRKSWLVGLQTAWLEKDQEESSYLSENMKMHFLACGSISSPNFDIPLEASLLESIKVEELQACLMSLIPCDLNHDVLAMVFQPTSRLRNFLNNVGLNSLSPTADWLFYQLGLGKWIGHTEVLDAVIKANTSSAKSCSSIKTTDQNVNPSSHSLSKSQMDTTTCVINGTESMLLNKMKSVSDAEYVKLHYDDGFSEFGGCTDDAAAVLGSSEHPRGWPADGYGGWIADGTNKGGGIVSSESLDLGIYEILLENGLKVTYRFNDYLEDEIYIKASAPGGLSELIPRVGHLSQGEQREVLFSCGYAARVATEFGTYGLPRQEVNDFASDKRVTVNKGVNVYQRKISGNCSPVDLETQLRLFHLLFTSKINPDEERLETAKRVIRENIVNNRNDPLTIFDNEIDSLTYGDHPLYAPAQESDVERFDSKLALAVYLSNFNDPSEWRFVFSGNLNPTVLKHLVVKYLGSIPVNQSRVDGMVAASSPSESEESSRTDVASSSPTSNTFKISDLKLSVPTSEYVTPLDIDIISQTTVKRLKLKMQDPLSRVEVFWPLVLGSEESSGPKGSNALSGVNLEKAHAFRLEQSLLLDFACTILEQRVRDVLRMKMSAVYGVSVSANMSATAPLKRSKPFAVMKGHLTVSFSCDPDMLLLLEQVVLREMDALRRVGPTASEVLTAVKTSRTSAEEYKRTNSYWASALLAGYNSPRYSGDVSKTISEREKLSELISQELEASLSDAMQTESRRSLENEYEMISNSDGLKEKETKKSRSWISKLRFWQKYEKHEDTSSIKSSISMGNSEEKEEETQTSATCGGSGSMVVDRKAPGSAGVERMQRYFMKILPPSTPHAVVSLQPAEPVPWKLIGTGVGVLASVAAVLVIVKARRLK